MPLDPTALIGMVVGGLVVILMLFILAIAKRYRKVGPNQALIISGGERGFRIVRGGGTFVWPIIEKVDVLSLEIMAVEVRVRDVHTEQGDPVVVDAVSQVRIPGEERAIAVAAERFLGKSAAAIGEFAEQVLEDHLRAVLRTVTVEEAQKNRAAVARQIRQAAVEDLARTGLEIVAFTIRGVEVGGVPPSGR